MTPARALAVLIAALLSVAVAIGDARAQDFDPYPLAPPDTSSPRTTLHSFVTNMNAAYQAYLNGQPGAVVARPFRRAVATLDLSDAPDSLHPDVGGYSVLLLKEILDRIQLPPLEDVPDREEMDVADLTDWTIPKTAITIRKQMDGERAGAFLFSARTVQSLPEFYELVRTLPYKPGSTQNLLEYYFENPGGIVPLHWAEWLPEWSMTPVFDRPIWKWVALLVFMVVAVASTVIAYRLERRWDRGVRDGAHFLRFGGLIVTLSVVFWAWALEVYVDDVVALRGHLEAAIKRVSLVISFSAAILALFALLEVIANVIVASNRIRKASAQAHFIRIILRLIGIGLSVFLVVEASEYIGWAVAPVLASLGVGGLAVALAARPTIENIIGGLILFLDKPARVGEFCRYGDHLGTVEEVGLRSTRIRSLDRTIVSVPNAELSQMPIENYARRDSMLFQAVINLRYETTSEQLRLVLIRLREMLLGHPRVSPDPARARFLQFGDSSLQVEIFAYVQSEDWNEYLAIREDLNLRIMDIVRDSGTSIAFPSRAVYWQRDPGLDQTLKAAAEAETGRLREAVRLPFPDFAKDVQWEIENMLEYPPPGSPDHRPRAGVSETPNDPTAPDAPADRPKPSTPERS